MIVSVKFFGAQRTLTKTRELKVSLAKNGHVREVREYLMNCYPGLLLEEEEILVTVNNKASTLNHSLNPDDSIAFLPHVGGG